jgi:hypothetical protein
MPGRARSESDTVTDMPVPRRPPDLARASGGGSGRRLLMILRLDS